MCGRYGLIAAEEQLRRQFALARLPAQLAPRYNVAPSQAILVVERGADGNQASLLRWGMPAFYAKSSQQALRRSVINARIESLAISPLYRRAARRGRVVVPASFFYEWRSDANGKVPVLISRKDMAPMALAGVAGRWVDPRSGEVIEGAAIVTTAANSLIRGIHDRMPVLLDQGQMDLWLDEAQAIASLLALGQSNDSDLLAARAVSPRLNDPRNDDPELIGPWPQGGGDDASAAEMSAEGGLSPSGLGRRSTERWAQDSTPRLATARRWAGSGWTRCQPIPRSPFGRQRRSPPPRRRSRPCRRRSRR